MINFQKNDNKLAFTVSTAAVTNIIVSYFEKGTEYRYPRTYFASTSSAGTNDALGTTNDNPVIFEEIRSIIFYNADASLSQTVQLKMWKPSLYFAFTPVITLLPGEAFYLTESASFVLDAQGVMKTYENASSKSLGQSAPSATTSTALYTVPAGKTAKLTSCFVTNRSAVACTFRISISVGGGAIANKDYLYYDTPINPNDTLMIDNLGFASATDIVRVYASTADLSFNLFGEEY